MSRIYVIEKPEQGGYICLEYKDNKLINNGLGISPMEALSSITNEVPAKPKTKTAVKKTVVINEDGINFADWFKDKLLKNKKDIRHFNRTKWSEEFVKLHKEYSKDDIYTACNYALSDTFWQDNFLTPMKLFKKNKEDMRYIEVFLSKAQKMNLTTTAWDIVNGEVQTKNKEKEIFTAKLAGMSALISAKYSDEVMRRKNLGKLRGNFDNNWKEYLEIYKSVGGTL